jgi:hypothetical protein
MCILIISLTPLIISCVKSFMLSVIASPKLLLLLFWSFSFELLSTVTRSKLLLLLWSLLRFSFQLLTIFESSKLLLFWSFSFELLSTVTRSKLLLLCLFLLPCELLLSASLLAGSSKEKI